MTDIIQEIEKAIINWKYKYDLLVDWHNSEIEKLKAENAEMKADFVETC